MKKIISLTNVFVKEFYQSLPIFDKTKNKFNKRSIFFWLIAIIFVGITYISYEIIKFLVEVGQPNIFLSLFFPILAIFLIFQTILICANIFFFAKDIKLVMHMPLKPEEILISKLLTLLCMLYVTEAVFAVVPLTLFGMMANTHFIYYLLELIVLIIFPILFVIVISTIMLIIMRFTRFIRNKDVFQVIVTSVLLLCVFLLEFSIMQGLFKINSNEEALDEFTSFSEKAQSVNKYFLVINPSVDMLSDPSNSWNFVSIGKLIIYNVLGLTIFILVGKITYLKDILKSNVSYTKRIKKKKNYSVNKRDLKQRRIAKSYINKELKTLLRHPIFFMQCIFPILIILFTIIMAGTVFSPIINEILKDEEISNVLSNLSFNAEILCYILIVLQVLFSISNISLTAISREGRDAILMKYIPIDLYKQFLYKNVLQILLNLLVTVFVLGIVWYYLPVMNFIYVFATFLIATVINFINSYLMLIVDLRRPNLNWVSEHSVVKKSDNKLFQYVLMIVNVLFLMYIAKILKDVNIFISLGIEFMIFLIILIIIDRCVKRWKDKLFNKIM